MAEILWVIFSVSRKSTIDELTMTRSPGLHMGSLAVCSSLGYLPCLPGILIKSLKQLVSSAGKLNGMTACVAPTAGLAAAMSIDDPLDSEKESASAHTEYCTQQVLRSLRTHTE